MRTTGAEQRRAGWRHRTTGRAHSWSRRGPCDRLTTPDVTQLPSSPMSAGSSGRIRHKMTTSGRPWSLAASSSSWIPGEVLPGARSQVWTNLLKHNRRRRLQGRRAQSGTRGATVMVRISGLARSACDVEARLPRSRATRAGGVMTGKVAIITGGSQGIGAGLVAGYRGRGWTVVASARAIEPTLQNAHQRSLPALSSAAGEPGFPVGDPGVADGGHGMRAIRPCPASAGTGTPRVARRRTAPAPARRRSGSPRRPR